MTSSVEDRLELRARLGDSTLAEEALAQTHTEEAPWFIVPGDRKPQARAIVAALLAGVLKQLAPDYPAEHPDVLEDYRQLLAANGVS